MLLYPASLSHGGGEVPEGEVPESLSSNKQHPQLRVV